MFSVLASLALTGCFVFDELDSGMEIMDEHSAAAKKTKVAKTEPTAADTGSEESQLSKWKAQVGEWWRNVLEEEPVGPDPNDIIVRCQTPGRVNFTRKSDCELRGGRYVAR